MLRKHRHKTLMSAKITLRKCPHFTYSRAFSITMLQTTIKLQIIIQGYQIRN